MAGRCMDHKGLCVEIANAQKAIEEIKNTGNLEKIWEELRKKPSTSTLLIGLGIVASVIMTIVTLVYYSHRSGNEKLEQQIQRNADQIEKTNKRVDDQYSGVIRALGATQNMIKERLPERKKESTRK